MIDSRPDALLAAYLDGIGELTRSERHDVEAWLAEQPAAETATTATRELLGQLRGLPADPAVSEPSWAALEHSIAAAVAELPAPRRWSWRRVVTRWVMPVSGLAMATAAALLWVHVGPAPALNAHGTHATHPAQPAPAAVATRGAAVAVPGLVVPATVAPAPVWLDGHAVELDGVDDPAGSVDAITDVVNDALGEMIADPMAAAATEGEAGGSLMPSNDLGWIDDLDATSVDRLDGWLRREKG